MGSTALSAMPEMRAPAPSAPAVGGMVASEGRATQVTIQNMNLTVAAPPNANPESFAEAFKREIERAIAGVVINFGGSPT
jgi:hypothetical protein